MPHESLDNTYYITANCLITGRKLFKNQKLIFEQNENARIFFDEVYNHFEIAYSKFHKMDQLCKLGFLAAEILLSGKNITKKYDESDIGIVLSNSHASLDVDLRFAKTIKSGASPALFVYTLPNIVIGEISIRHRIKGENAFFVFKNFDGNFITEYVNSIFNSQLAKCCICGWVDYFQEDYRALLMLVETGNSAENALPFTAANMIKLNEQDHG
jgi:hypothetical protein